MNTVPYCILSLLIKFFPDPSGCEWLPCLAASKGLLMLSIPGSLVGKWLLCVSLFHALLMMVSRM